LSVLLSSHLNAAIYEVGPGKARTKIGQVPWNSLKAGDTVLIYWSTAPYREKWVLTAQGTASAPITVKGVPYNGLRPIIDGSGATTVPGQNFWNDERGLLKIGGSSIPANVMPAHIIIEGLEFRNAREGVQFKTDTGAASVFARNAAAIYVERAENLTIRDCALRDSGNGLFIGSYDSPATRNIHIEANYFSGNGNANSAYEHHVYTAAIGIVFEFNQFAPLRATSQGTAIKDRSAGTVIRYNWIEGGNRQIDLVDSNLPSFVSNPLYSESQVYGNVLIENAGTDNRQIVHYGGDSANLSNYRRGTLFFYNNTVVSKRTDRNTLFRLSTLDQRADVRNNIFYTVLPGTSLSLVDRYANITFANNWIKPGFLSCYCTPEGSLLQSGWITGSAPGFVNEAAMDYRLVSTSPLLDRGIWPDSRVLPDHNVTQEYVKHRLRKTKPLNAVLPVGAFGR